MADKGAIKIVVILAVSTFAFAAVIVTQLPKDQESRAAPHVAAGGDDWLEHELERCRTLGPGDRPDDRCEAAWAESRRRFFGDHAKGR